MDEVDLAILRAMTRDLVFWWGTKDPRVSSDDVARTLGLAGSTVRARIQAWEKAGFLLAHDVMPNPSLLGARVAGGELRVDDPRHKAQVLEDLALVEGVVGALDHVGPWVGLAYAYESDAALARAQRLVARLPGVVESTSCPSPGQDAAKIAPTALDWRIIQAMRQDACAPLARLAEAVGVSTRTFTRRYGALVEAGAVWVLPVLDFTRWDGVVARLIASVAPGANGNAVARGLRQEFPNLMELHAHRLVDGHVASVDVLLPLRSVGAVEDAHVKALGVPGVAGIEVVYPRRYHAYPSWFDERIAARAGKPLARAVGMPPAMAAPAAAAEPLAARPMAPPAARA